MTTFSKTTWDSFDCVFGVFSQNMIYIKQKDLNSNELILLKFNYAYIDTYQNLPT